MSASSQGPATVAGLWPRHGRSLTPHLGPSLLGVASAPLPRQEFAHVCSRCAERGRREVRTDPPPKGARMRKLFVGTRAGVIAVVLAATVAVAGPASAADAPRTAGAGCVPGGQAGLSTLKSLGLLQAAAQKQLDYSTLADPTTGPIFTTLPEGSYLSLGQVVKLHTTNPDLFAWCRWSPSRPH